MIVKKLSVALLALFVLSTAFAAASCRSSYSGTAESIVVSYAPFQTLALLWTADERGLFKENGIATTVREYDTGAASLDAVLNGGADIAVGPAEFPLVGRAFKKERIRAIAGIDKIEHIAVVARKDRGIEQASSLKGKKVGTTLGTVSEFYLGRLLELNGLSRQAVTVVDLKTPPEWENAVVDGEIDAVVTAQPWANSARDRLGANAVFWSAQSSQPMHALIIATNEWIAEHPELVNRFLKSLAQAEEYVNRNPTAAKAIVQKRLNLDASDMETIWAQNQYGLSLDQSLITAMEDEARWMISNNLTNEKTVPDFLDYIHVDGLMAVRPEAVSIIR